MSPLRSSGNAADGDELETKRGRRPISIPLGRTQRERFAMPGSLRSCAEQDAPGPKSERDSPGTRSALKRLVGRIGHGDRNHVPLRRFLGKVQSFKSHGVLLTPGSSISISTSRGTASTTKPLIAKMPAVYAKPGRPHPHRGTRPAPGRGRLDSQRSILQFGNAC
jgi:hypothetical protein